MATLAPLGRINEEAVRDEIGRLGLLWGAGPVEGGDGDSVLREVLGPDGAAGIDPFDRVQLAAVIRACRDSSSISAAGRKLFSVSRLKKASGNDADRLRKYLQRFSLSFDDVARA